MQANQAGSYAVVVTNVAGSATSAVALLTVWVPPAIVTQPQSTTNVVGTTASFSVTASGTAPLSYQWLSNGTNVTGATGTNLSLNNVQVGQAGSYAVVVTNVAGSVTSAVALLTVWVPPAIVAQPQSSTNVVGTTASFSVTASGTMPLSYQWQSNGTNVSGATSTSLTLNNVQANQAGSYAVVVTNVAGSVTSSSGAIDGMGAASHCDPAPDTTNVVGTTASFSVTASGTAPLSYQWQSNGTNAPGATSTSLTLNNAANQAGSYAVVVTNVAGSVTSPVALLTVWVPPAIVTQPQSTTNVVGATASFSVSQPAGLPPELPVAVERHQCNWSHRHQPELEQRAGGPGGQLCGGSDQRGGVGDQCGGAIDGMGAASRRAQPQSSTNVVGTTANFSVTASGTAPLSYQWLSNGTNVTGATSASLSLNNVQVGQAGSYAVVVTNAAGSVTSAVALLTVWVPPAIVTQPQVPPTW